MSKQPSRLEQIGALMTAMIAVIVSGQSKLTDSPKVSKKKVAESADASPRPEVDGANPFFNSVHLRGVISTVAHEMNLTHEHVRQVAYGRRKSARVANAIAKEIEARSLAAKNGGGK